MNHGAFSLHVVPLADSSELPTVQVNSFNSLSEAQVSSPCCPEAICAVGRVVSEGPGLYLNVTVMLSAVSAAIQRLNLTCDRSCPVTESFP